MSRRRRSLSENLDKALAKGADEFIGFQVDGEWEGVAVPYSVLLTQTAQLLPTYVDCVPPKHEARRTFRWTRIIVRKRHGVRIDRVPSKNRGFVTMQPHRIEAVKKAPASTNGQSSWSAASTDQFDHELQTDNFPAVALRLIDETVVAEDPNHPIAVDMAKTFMDLRDKLNTDDLRAFVAWIIRKRLGGVKKLKAASTWFVPYTEEAANVLPALQNIVRACEPFCEVDADLYVTRMPRTEEDDVRCATKSAQKTFASEYRGIVKEIEGFIQVMFSGDVTQNSTLKNRLSASSFLRERAELYQDILDLRSENMTKALEVLEEATEALIDGAGEYRIVMKEAKKLPDKEREKEEKAAKADLEKWAKEAEALMVKCRGILDPGEDTEDEEEEAA